SPEHALGSALHKHIANADCQAFLQAACTSNPQELRFTLNQDNGRMRHIRLIRTAFMQQSELIIAEDISRAEQLQATRTAFIANVSHELRTPLTVINGFLETLADYPDLPSEQRAQFVALMQNESQRMLNLIHDLMMLSALEDP
ncbi:histidine kinase dimerization/phospho-acceptor domain-containing protein, partial [Kingella kingae]